MKILFLGNHTLGVRVLERIAEQDHIVGVIAHPPDPEDGNRYESVFEFARERRWRTLRARPRDPEFEPFVRDADPDLMWITDYRYLLPPSILRIPRLGTVNLHPSLLPAYRGRAVLNWAILNGERQLGLTAHFVDEGIDTGDIIEQVSYELSEEEDVGDALQVLYPLYTSVTSRVLQYFRSGQVPRRPQTGGSGQVCGRRTPEDGRIDWNLPSGKIRNLVRAVAHPYPGAFAYWGHRRLAVWRAQASDLKPTTAPPGTLLALTPEGVHVQCGCGVLCLTSVTWQDGSQAVELEVGSRFE